MRNIIFFAILVLASQNAFAYGSVFDQQKYSLDLLGGVKASEPVSGSEVNAEASAYQIGGYFHPYSWFATGLLGSFNTYDKSTLGDSISEASGYDVLWDLKFSTPDLDLNFVKIGAYVKLGFVLASEYTVEAKALSEEDQYALAGELEDISYNIRHKVQGYRSAVGFKTLASKEVMGMSSGLIVELASGQEKWIKRRYFYEGQKRDLNRDDKPLNYQEFLVGFHLIK